MLDKVQIAELEPLVRALSKLEYSATLSRQSNPMADRIFIAHVLDQRMADMLTTAVNENSKAYLDGRYNPKSRVLEIKIRNPEAMKYGEITAIAELVDSLKQYGVDVQERVALKI